MKFLFVLLLSFAISLPLYAQVAVGSSTPHLSSVLDLVSSTKGFLAPRMTSSARTNIPLVTKGLMVFDSSLNRFYFWDGYTPTSSSYLLDNSYWGKFSNSDNIYNISGNVSIGTTLPSPSALLDLTSSSKGLLVPRMTRANRDDITSPATSLLIYQTNETPGFMYNAGTSVIPNWVRMSRRLDTLVVSAHAFLPGNSGDAYATSAGSLRYIPTTGSTSPLYAPVSLPAGATIKTMKAYYVDDASSASIKVTLFANILTLGSLYETPFVFTSSSTSGSIRTGTVNGSYTVKNNEHAYLISVFPVAGAWNPQADIAIKGVMIIYEY